MTVVHIAYYYGLNHTGGACIAATRIHNALVRAGFDSHYVCVFQREAGPNVHVLPKAGTMSRLLYFVATKCFRGIWRLSPYRKSICMNLMPLLGSKQLLKELNPDVVHVQWINADVMSFEELRNIKYPVLFHLHDIWMLNALAPYAADDTRYSTGFFKGNSKCLERWMFSRKLRTVRELQAAFVGPSKWICGFCKKSLIGGNSFVECIPYLYDRRFKYNASIRESHERFVVLFGCFGGRANQIKGWDDFWSSVKLLPPDVRNRMQVNVFGEVFSDYEEMGVKLHCLGVIRDPVKMIYECHQADISVLPSRQDNAPSTKFEALFCGLPVIAFDRTGCAEEIDHKVTGWIAQDGDINAYADGLLFFYDKWEKGAIDHAYVAKLIEGKIGEQETVRRMTALYEKCVGCK